MTLDPQEQVGREAATDRLDASTAVIYLEVPRQGVVLLQAYFELHEGLGMVRTLRGTMPKKDHCGSSEEPSATSLIGVLTSPSLEIDCHEALRLIRSQVEWAYFPAPPDTPEGRKARDVYFGTCANASDIT